MYLFKTFIHDWVAPAYFKVRTRLAGGEQDNSPVEHLYTKRRTALNPEKQKQLDFLCQELFKRKELITSGKLQFVGLARIKGRMGKRWLGLRQVVYDTTEDVIREYMDRGDIFVRYQDDTYVILFAHATHEQGVQKSERIAQEVQKRLFALDEKELQKIEIQHAANTVRTDQLFDRTFEDVLGDMFEEEDNDFSKPVYSLQRETDMGALLPEVKKTEVNTQTFRLLGPGTRKGSLQDIKDVEYAYVPLWDVKRKALTSYLLMARTGMTQGADLLESYTALCQSYAENDKLMLDLNVLEKAKAELAAMEKDGRKLLVVCPVQYESLHRFETYEVYKQAVIDIPLAQRQFLVFMVLIPEGDVPQRDAYWFVKPLRVFCRQVFAEIPMQRDINFGYLRQTGVDAIGMCLDRTINEKATINRLNGLITKAKKNNIPCGFVLGVRSLSLATSIICGGVDFIGGSVIHDAVERPENIHKFSYEDLVKDLMA